MAGEPNSIVTLKKFYGDRLHEPSAEDFMAELVESNDRSAIITMSSLTDAGVEFLLIQNLPALKHATEQQINKAMSHDGPLGTFSARIDMVFYLGLIDDALRNQLHDLRALRNAVAHTKRRVTFADVPLQNVAKRLFHPIGKFQLLQNTAHGYRATLIAEANLIYLSVIHGRNEAVRLTQESFTKAGKTPPF